MNTPKGNLFNFFFQNKRKYILLAIGIIVFVLFQLDKNNRFDDDLIGEQVYHFLQNGYVKSEMMRGYGNLHLEYYQTIYHKLFVYWGALWTKVLGWSLYSLHLASLFFLLIFVVLLYSYCSKQSRSLGIFCISFLLITYNILYFSNCYRPEIMLMSLGFGSFWSIQLYSEKKIKSFLYISALLAGLAFATHPHGIIYCLSGAIILLFYRKPLAFLVFCIICSSLFTVIYFTDIYIYGQFDLFWYQLQNDPIINARAHHWYTPIIKLAKEHVRLFFNEREISISLLLIFGLIFNFKFLWNKHKLLMLYGTCCFIFLGFTTYSKSPQYLLLYYPFTLLIIGYAWKHVEEKNLTTPKYVYRLLLLAFIIIHGTFAIKHIIKNVKNINSPSLSKSNQEVTNTIPLPHHDKSLLAYDEIIFDEIKHFKRIKTFAQYSFFREQHQRKMSFEEVIQAAKKDSVDYVIFNKHYISYYQITQTSLVKERLNIITNNDRILIVSLP